MTLAAIIIAFLLDQIRSAGADYAAAAPLRRWIHAVAGHVDAGGRQHAWLIWLLVVAAPALAVGVLGWICAHVAGWLGQLAWSVAVLYCALGFRQFSHRYTAIRDALAAGDETRARELLAQWQDEEVGPLPRGAAAQGLIARGVIAQAVLSAHRCVFGVLFWFCLLTPLGLAPAGAVLYRHADFAVRHWRRKAGDGEPAADDALLSVVQMAWRVIDWLPARVTALAFAIVGNFEDAIDAWRRCATATATSGDAAGSSDAIVLAAAAGALGIRLRDEPGRADAGPAAPADGGLAAAAFVHPGGDSVGHVDAAPTSGDAPSSIYPPHPPDWAPAGTLPDAASDNNDAETCDVSGSANPDARHFAQVAGLLWRSVALWLLMLVLLTLAHVLG